MLNKTQETFEQHVDDNFEMLADQYLEHDDNVNKKFAEWAMATGSQEGILDDELVDWFTDRFHSLFKSWLKQDKKQLDAFEEYCHNVYFAEIIDPDSMYDELKDLELLANENGSHQSK